MSPAIALALAMGIPMGCSPREQVPETVPARYRFLYDIGYSADEAARLRAGLPYEKIELEYFSTWIWGGDEVTLQADGNATMIDDRGHWKGRVGLRDFGFLCYLLETHGFEDLRPRYSRDVFDAGTVTIRVWPRGAGDPISVESYAAAAPLGFWTLETSINGVVHSIRWESAEPGGSAPD